MKDEAVITDRIRTKTVKFFIPWSEVNLELMRYREILNYHLRHLVILEIVRKINLLVLFYPGIEIYNQKRFRHCYRSAQNLFSY